VLEDDAKLKAGFGESMAELWECLDSMDAQGREWDIVFLGYMEPDSIASASAAAIRKGGGKRRKQQQELKQKQKRVYVELSKRALPMRVVDKEKFEQAGGAAGGGGDGGDRDDEDDDDDDEEVAQTDPRGEKEIKKKSKKHAIQLVPIKKQKVSASAAGFGGGSSAMCTNKHLLVVPGYSWGLHGYVLKHCGASKLLKSLPISSPVDVFVSTLHAESGGLHLKALALTTPIVAQDKDLSSDIAHSGMLRQQQHHRGSMNSARKGPGWRG